MNLKIAICGGGSLGHVISGFLSSQKDVSVNILTRRPNDWSHDLIVEDLKGKNYAGRLNLISDNPQVVLDGVDLVLLCLPGFSIREELVTLRDYLSPNIAIGSVVSSTGFFFQAFDILPKNQSLFGFQRVPFIARTNKYGHSANLLGYKPSLNVAIENCEKSPLANILSSLFRCPVNILGSFYEASLTNSNPILHTARLYNLWKDYYPGVVYEICPQFYSDWTVDSSRLLIAMDNEFQLLLKHLPVSSNSIPTLLDYYESKDEFTLTHKIKSISSFMGLLAPMIDVEEGFIPNIDSRYFTEDFPFGLRFIYDLIKSKNIDAPFISKVYDWGMQMLK